VVNGAVLRRLILIPAVITLAVTLLRLAGELMGWSRALFNPASGGGGAIVGIVWLVPVFGIYFVLKLAALGEAPSSAAATIAYSLLGLALVPAAAFAVARLGVFSPHGFGPFASSMALSVLGAIVAYRGWPSLGRVLLGYGLAARVPVVLVMLFAMLGGWGTHYDVAAPGTPEMGPLQKWLLIGVLPQLTIWIWYTIAVGALFGGLAAAVTARVRRAAFVGGRQAV
jgi:hypothetical protein